LGLWSFANEYGTTGDGLSEDITSVEDTVDAAFNDAINRDAVVTYTTNGRHSRNSLHYCGDAIDLRTRDMDNEEVNNVLEQLRNYLGDDYDVIFEGDHIHLEYDPSAN
jgi:RNA binding exosome subunit